VQPCSNQVFCVCMNYGGSRYLQMLAGLCRSLFSALCFDFTDQGWRELTKREKNNKRKRKSGRLALAICPCLELFPAGKQTGGPAAVSCPCSRLLCSLKS
jgi:hypothetical protein